MVTYRPKPNWDELKAKVPKLISGVYHEDQLTEFEASPELTEAELAVLQAMTGRRWGKD